MEDIIYNGSLMVTGRRSRKYYFCPYFKRIDMLDKLERKLGKIAVPHLMNYLIAGYIIGYVFMLVIPDILELMTLDPYMIIHKFQIWRVVSWVLIPPSRFSIFTILMLLFYWQLGRNLEQMWGTFRFNLYIASGVFFTVIGAFIYYGAIFGITGLEVAGIGAFFSTYYINMSIFLAFALSIPDMRVMLYFFIPIKMKWLGFVYAAIIAYSFFTALYFQRYGECVAIVCSLANFFIIFAATRNFKSFGRTLKNQGWRRPGGGPQRQGPGFGGGAQTGQGPFGQTGYGQGGYGQQGQGGYGGAQQGGFGGGQGSPFGKQGAQPGISRHRCAICGRTEITNPELEFRFCSKCNGNYEYCNEHLFSHTHVE